MFVIAPFAIGETLPEAAQRRLLAIRAVLILGEAAGVLLLVSLLGARLPLTPLMLVIALHLALNGAAWLRLRESGEGRGVGAVEATLQLAVDALCIGALVFLTGGYANPFISLLLVPLILAAVTLPTGHGWAMAAWVGILYTLLMRFYRPLEMQVSAEAAVDLHLTGMWLNFLLTAVLVAAFAGRLAASLRRRDAELAAAREQRLRDEQLFALGLQAATAAHELATPMGSLRLTLDDLRQDYAGDDELERPLALMSGQLARMEAVLDQLGRAARARPTTSRSALDAAVWLRRLVEHWGLMWPNVRIEMDLAEGLPAISDDTTLAAVLTSLLNNAAQASPGHVTLAAEARRGYLEVSVSDRGGGLAAGKPEGWGVGLDLARAALARMGGELLLEETGGGLLGRVVVPLAGLR